MATITELLTERWNEKQTTEAIMKARVAFQALKQAAVLAKAKIAEVMIDGSFTNVHSDLKTEGQACLTILNKFLEDLDARTEFIDFTPE